MTITDGHKLPSCQSQMDTNFSLDNNRWTQTSALQSQMDTHFRLDNHRWTHIFRLLNHGWILTCVVTITDGHKRPS